jgi:hypothetical protein
VACLYILDALQLCFHERTVHVPSLILLKISSPGLTAKLSGGTPTTQYEPAVLRNAK